MHNMKVDAVNEAGATIDALTASQQAVLNRYNIYQILLTGSSPSV